MSRGGGLLSITTINWFCKPEHELFRIIIFDDDSAFFDQDKIGIKTTQSGTMQIKEVRCKIGSEEYFKLINNL